MRIVPEPAPLDVRHLDLGPPLADDPAPGEGGALVVFDGGPPSARRRDPAGPRLRAPEPPLSLGPPASGRGQPHVRYMTPREMQDYSQDLYAAGIVAFEDYEALAFQPDLHPDFARTIGALTGERPGPDRPRDFIRAWEERLRFWQRYAPADAPEVRQARRILKALKAFPRPIDALV